MKTLLIILVLAFSGCATPLGKRLVSDGKAIAGQIITIEERKLVDKLQ